MARSKAARQWVARLWDLVLTLTQPPPPLYLTDHLLLSPTPTLLHPPTTPCSPSSSLPVCPPPPPLTAALALAQAFVPPLQCITACLGIADVYAKCAPVAADSTKFADCLKPLCSVRLPSPLLTPGLGPLRPRAVRQVLRRGQRREHRPLLGPHQPGVPDHRRRRAGGDGRRGCPRRAPRPCPRWRRARRTRLVQFVSGCLGCRVTFC
jgi:hypothetical protein